MQGRPLDTNNEANIKNVRGTECAILAWHPLLPLLAIGWKDGKRSQWPGALALATVSPPSGRVQLSRAGQPFPITG